MVAVPTQFKTNAQGHVLLTLPRSGVKVALRSPKGKDTRALQSAVDSSGNSLSDYDLGLLLLERCVVSFGDKDKATQEDFDELDLADLQLLEQGLAFFR